MMRVKYREGDVYYRLTFPDARLNYPKIDTFVFVGKNLSDEDAEDTWYFQFADSYVKDGSILSAGGRDGRVCLATASDLPEILDLPGLVKELEAAERRRHA